MSELHLERFDKPKDFLEAVQFFDDTSMSFALGEVCDRLNPQFSEEGDEPWESRTVDQHTFMTIWKNEQLVTALSRADETRPWVLSVPRGVQESFPHDVTEAVSLLANALLEILDEPKGLNAVLGPADVVKAFLDAWAALLPAWGLNAILTTPEATHFRTQTSYATLATLPPLASNSPGYDIARAQTPEDALAIAKLVVAFSNHTGISQTTLEQAAAQMRAALRMQQLWLCRIDGEIVAYLLAGRATPKTVGIRNVYVAPEHRRKGITEAMVRCITRWYLGVEPTGMVNAPVLLEEAKRPKEVSLYVAEEAVARIYARCGYLLHEGDRDPETGLVAAFDSLDVRPKYVEILASPTRM